MQKNEKVEFLSTIILLGFFAAVVYHYTIKFYFGAVYPESTFMFVGTAFNDFYISLIQVASFTPYNMGELTAQYFPFSYMLIYPFTKMLPGNALAIYLTFFCVMLFSYIYYYCSEPGLSELILNRNIKNIFLIAFVSYPFLFSFERANLESLLFIFVALSIIAYQHQRWIFAAIFLGMAGAMKLYPLFLVIYFLADRRYLTAVMSFLIAIILIVACLAIFEPGLTANLEGWKHALTGLSDLIVSDPGIAINYNVGIWGVIKAYAIGHSHSGHHSLLIKYKFFHLFALIYLLFISGFIMFIEKSAWRRLFLAVSTILLLPEMSNDYKLLYLYIPLVYFMNAPTSRSDWFYLIAFSLLMIPKNYYFIYSGMSISPFINVTLLLSMVLGIVAQGFYNKMRSTNI
jgi:hypothetical protein